MKRIPHIPNNLQGFRWFFFRSVTFVHCSDIVNYLHLDDFFLRSFWKMVNLPDHFPGVYQILFFNPMRLDSARICHFRYRTSSHSNADELSWQISAQSNHLPLVHHQHTHKNPSKNCVFLKSHHTVDGSEILHQSIKQKIPFFIGFQKYPKWLAWDFWTHQQYQKPQIHVMSAPKFPRPKHRPGPSPTWISTSRRFVVFLASWKKIEQQKLAVSKTVSLVNGCWNGSPKRWM